MSINVLIEALRAAQKKVCLDAASQLDALDTKRSSFDLHLRQAGLDRQDTLNIAEAMRSLREASLRSFSVSYNSGIQDVGAVALTKSFPPTLTEIGMVGCGLGDESG